jgi:malonyl-CoA/methylmalonyl-CoA synthetase
VYGPVSPGWPVAATGDGQLALRLPSNQLVDYGELRSNAGRAAGWLAARGVRAGDRVLIPARKDYAFIALHIGTLQLGAISTPFNPASTPPEVEHLREDSGARLIADVREIPEGSPAPQATPAASDPALLLYTSGTTGKPKGVLHTHGGLHANLAALHEAWEWSERDSLLHALPLFHVHGLVVALHGALYAGAFCKLLERFDASDVMTAMPGQTIFMGVPTMYRRLAAQPSELVPRSAWLRLWVCGSAPLPAADRAAFASRFGTVPLERYGMTETLMIASQPLRGERRAGSAGRALPGVELRVVAPESRAPLPAGATGEVEVRGPSLFAGYWQAPEPTAQTLGPDGWLRTGDVGVLDADGTLTLVGRAKDVILCGGFNIYPLEVEAALLEHPDVADCAVFAQPDPDLFETVAAAVVAVPGRAPTPEALLAHCHARLAPHKCPRSLRLLVALPRNAMGKVNRAALAAAPAGAPHA